MKKGIIDSGRSVSARVCLLVLVMILLPCATPAEAMPKSAGIWLSRHSAHALHSRNEDQLTRNLQIITGLPELHFSRQGLLLLGDVSAANGGSAVARQVLLRALGSGHVFLIEDHERSTSVNFGQMDEGTNYEDLLIGCHFLVWRVRLDFDDFRRMQASPEVRDTFNAGFTMLHEVLHGLGYRDAKHLEEIGECEELINQARAELGLPLREQYFGDLLRFTKTVSTVRLPFNSQAKPTADGPNKKNKRRRQYLFFTISVEKQHSP
ncbi:MAG TPA: hypothetical protein PLD20_24985 [Blastocatellia bacterium]|nr:hypothetical protein [Blastocatellia bacterium]HMV86295.1 hypothetical protein [Blastocatellia bacterium]HMX29876.1 hypothetical protein [Blastocatellia bacterium]HMY72384.1 hypothetical protein [Blastocatellia bacterium]HMZ21214.1 hypothetical protein [Blastocatellia bacterium]